MDIVEVAVRDRVEQSRKIRRAHVDALLEVAGSGAVFLDDDGRAARLDEVVDLPVRDDDRRPGDEDARGVRREGALAACDARLALVGEFVRLLDEALGVVVERDLTHEEGVLAGKRRWRRLARVVEARKGRALPVDDIRRLPEAFERQFVAGLLLEHADEPVEFSAPQRETGRALRVGQVHDVNGDVLSENLPGLLLAVARVLSDDEIHRLEVGTGSREFRADARLDQGAQIARQDGLARRDPELRPRAEAYRDGSEREYDLLGDVDAERPDDLLSPGLVFEEFLDAQTVDLSDDHVVIAHSFGTLLLFEIVLLKHRRQRGAEQVMRRQVHPEGFPHLVIVRHTSPLSIVSRSSVFGCAQRAPAHARRQARFREEATTRSVEP